MVTYIIDSSTHSFAETLEGGCWPVALWLLQRALAMAAADSVAVAAAQGGLAVAGSECGFPKGPKYTQIKSERSCSHAFG